MSKQSLCTKGYELVYQLVNEAVKPTSIEITIYDDVLLKFTTLSYKDKQFKAVQTTNEAELAAVLTPVLNKIIIDGSRRESEMAPSEKTSVSCICCGRIQEEVNEEICSICKESGIYPADIYGY